MEIVSQRTDSDCTIASLAIYTGQCYEDIEMARIKLGFKCPMSPDEEIRILRHFGYKPVVLQQWVWQVPCIVSVPSINIPTLAHAVVWSGDCSEGKVFDPQSTRENKKFYTTEMFLNCRSWSHCICDLRDETVMMFAKMEIEEIQKRINEIDNRSNND